MDHNQDEYAAADRQQEASNQAETIENERVNDQKRVEELSEWLNQANQSNQANQDLSETAVEESASVDVENIGETVHSTDAAAGKSEPEIDLADIAFEPDNDDELTEKSNKKRLPVKKPVLITGIAVGTLVLIYAIGCIFYHSHFFNRAKINDVNVANCSVETVVQQLKDDEGNYVLNLKKRDQSTVALNGKDFDCHYDDNGTVRKSLDTQSCWKWPVGLFTDTIYTADLGYQYDDTKLQTAIDALGLTQVENVEPAVNAHPVWQDGAVQIVSEVYGNTIIQDKLNAAVREAVQKGKDELNLVTAGAYETPKYLSDAPEVAAAKTAMEKAAKSVLTYTIDENREVLDVGTFGSWLICDENMNVTVDQDQGAAYLATLGNKYDTAGGDYNFTTSGGSQIVISGGTFGWAVDESAELPLMTADILSGETTTRPISSKGASSRTGAKDIGNTYVEISIDAQTMWLYVDGSCLVSTPIVTGGPGHRTPTGVYRIEAHTRNTTLKGRNDDGSEYASFVNYWMPFYYAEGDGIHDASWRSSFGGSIYLSDGSHGCVNTPYAAVEVIFNNTSNGCPVVIY